MNSFVLGPNQVKWLEALESGDYQQERGTLRSGNGYCCLGVAAELFKTEDVVVECHGTKRKYHIYDGESACAPKYAQDALKLFDNVGQPTVGTWLTELNDNGSTFEQIAALVRLHPHHYFKEPA